MRHYYYPAAVLLAGLIAAQILFSGLVRVSNLSLHDNLIAIQAAGYVTVPNEHVMPSLRQLTPAICGGLFFTLTTGAGLSLAAFLIMCIWQRISKQYWLLIAMFLAAAVFFAVRFLFCLPMIITCLLTIAAVISASLFFFQDSKNSDIREGYSLLTVFAAHLVVAVLIGLIWIPAANKDVFVSIRDNLLLSNPIGQKINNFYYQYTLFPAEAFKSLDQKLLKSCHIVIDDKELYQQVKQKMVVNDYLPVDEKFAADLTVTDENTHALIFRVHTKTIHQCSVDEFRTESEEILELISEKTDQNKFLRKITFLSLIVASPLICYIFLHAVFMAGFFFIRPPKLRFAGASLACLILFSMPAIPLYLYSPDTIEAVDFAKFLKSDHWQDRVAALKAISDQNVKIERYIDPDPIIDSPWIPERYWLAKALGNSRSMESYQRILRLLEDSQPNVVCMAIYSLGTQNRSGAISEIIRRLTTTDHWYVQWYAYKALKRLGWTQKK